jgi:phage terminase small subunit
VAKVTDRDGSPVDILETLRESNKWAAESALRLYADAIEVYAEAADNVRRVGAICSHPKTGAPIENPYLRVQESRAAMLSKLRGKLDDSEVWRRLDGATFEK